MKLACFQLSFTCVSDCSFILPIESLLQNFWNLRLGLSNCYFCRGLKSISVLVIIFKTNQLSRLKFSPLFYFKDQRKCYPQVFLTSFFSLWSQQKAAVSEGVYTFFRMYLYSRPIFQRFSFLSVDFPVISKYTLKPFSALGRLAGSICRACDF